MDKREPSTPELKVVPDSVALLMPCAGAVDPRVLQNALVLSMQAMKNGYPIRQVGVTERTMIDTARNLLAEGFLKTDCEWAFWMDSDMILEDRTIPVMMRWAKKLDAKFLTGVYYQRMGKHFPVIFVKDKNKEYKDPKAHSPVMPPKGCKEPFLVHRAGFGCILMHRSVLEGMTYPYFDYQKDFSEDFYFCEKAQQSGQSLWAIPELRCGHIGFSRIITADDAVDIETTKVEVMAFRPSGDTVLG